MTHTGRLSASNPTLAPDSAVRAALTDVWQAARRRGARGVALYTGAGGRGTCQAAHGEDVTFPPDVTSVAPGSAAGDETLAAVVPPRRQETPRDDGHLLGLAWLALGPQASLGWLAVALAGEATADDLTGRRWAAVRRAAEALALALDRQRLADELTWSQTETAILNRVSRLVNSSLSLGSTFETIANELAAACDYPWVTIYRRVGDLLIREAKHGRDDGVSTTRIPIGRGIVGRAARTGRTQWAPDVNADADYLPALNGVRSEIAVPLCTAGRILGVLNVESHAARPLAARDVHLLEALAEQMSVSIENARLYGEAQQRLADLEALWNVSLDVSARLDLPTLLQLVLERAAGTTAASTGAVYLVEPHQACLTPIAVYHPFATTACRPLAEAGALGQVVETKAACVIPDYQAWPTRDALPEFAAARAVLGVPLVWDKTVLGVLALAHSAPDDVFTPAQQQAVALLAAQAASAVQTVRLYEAEQRKARRLAALHTIHRELALSLNRDELAQRIVTLVRRHFDYPQVALYLVDGDHLRPVGGEGASASLNLGQGVIGWVAQMGQSLLAPDSRPTPTLTAAGTLATTRSQLSVPLSLGERVLGVLDVQSEKPAAFDEVDEVALEVVASQAAVALTNAQLYTDMAAARARAETILHAAQVGLVELDERWRIVTLNPAAVRILGVGPDAARGMPLARVLPAASLRAVRETLGGRADDGRADDLARRMTEVRLAERQIDLLVGVARLQPGYLVSLLDVTALKEIDRLKSDILANFSHELRAPLASIKAYTELVLHYSDVSDTPSVQFLAVVNQETDRLTGLVNDILDMSRLEAGRPEMEFSLVAPRGLIDEVLALVAPQAHQNDVRIEVDIAPDVPPLWGDRQLLSMILRNLVVNAVKYNRPGGRVAIQVDEVTEGQHERFSRLRVRDTGIGIPAAALPRLFEKFYRVRSTTESGIQGSGLGLALAKAAVEAHRGSISVTTEEGEGTEFAVLIPCTNKATPPLTQPATTRRAHSSSGRK